MRVMRASAFHNVVVAMSFMSASVGFTPTSDVTEIQRLSMDVAQFDAAMGANYTLAKDVYINGMNSCLSPRSVWVGDCAARTIQSLNAVQTGTTYFDAFKSYYSSDASWNDLMMPALDGSGLMSSKNDKFRSMVGKKGVLGLMNMNVHIAIDSALTLAATGNVTLASQMIDKSWALYYGLEGKSAPVAVVGKRDSDFPDGLQALKWIPKLYERLQSAVRSAPYDAASAQTARSDIYRALLITYLRAAIKYAGKTEASINNGAYSPKYHSEGYTYWRAASAYVASINRTAADIVEDAFMLSKDENSLSPTMHCQVKDALEASYAALGVDCSMVGHWTDYDPQKCDSPCSSLAVTSFSIFGFPLTATTSDGFTLLGGYQPISDVMTEATLVHDDVNSFTVAVASNYTLSKHIYTAGKSSSQHTLQDLNEAHVGDPYFDAYASFYSSTTSWDDLLLLALDGTGAMNGKDAIVRGMVAKKGVLGLLNMVLHYHLESGLSSGAAGARGNSEAPRGVDLAWALFHGIDGSSSPYAVAGKRDTDFPTGTKVKEMMLPLFQEAQLALQAATYDAGKASRAVAGIYRGNLITFIRAAIKYAYKVQSSVAQGSYSSKYHSEGYVYWRAVSAYVASFNRTAADIVEDALLWTKDGTELAPDMYCQVKRALEGSYATLGLDCTMVGNFKDVDASYCDEVCSSLTVPMLPIGDPAALALPVLTGFGLTPLGLYYPLSNVIDVSKLSTDVSLFNAATSSNYTLAEEIYLHGTVQRRLSSSSSANSWTLRSLNVARPGFNYFDASVAFYNSQAAWDDFILQGLRGDGGMASMSDIFRGMVVKKGVLGLMSMYLTYGVEEGPQLAQAGLHASAVKAWDESWAVYFGTQGSNVPSAVAGKRDTDFPNGIKVNDVMPRLYAWGQKHLESTYYDHQKAIQAQDGILRCSLITYIRAAIKYSYKVQKSVSDGAYSAKYHAEGYTHWRAVSAHVASINRTAADIVEDQLMWTKTSGAFAADMHCKVKHALESAYQSLGIDCSMVGDWKDLPATYCSPTCTAPAATAIPDGELFTRAIGAANLQAVQSSQSGGTVSVFCSVGESFNGVQCQACPAGKSNPQSDSECRECQPGFFANDTGLSTCLACLPGSYAGGDIWAGRTACTLCTTGEFASEPGSRRCSLCPEGLISAQNGSDECSRCPVGSFADMKGLTTCESCPTGRATPFAGAGSLSDCICPAGTYYDPKSDNCLVCPEGMTCPLGSDARYFPQSSNASLQVSCPRLNVPCGYPTSLPGYTTQFAEPVKVFKCKPSNRCPGGPPGICALNRDVTSPACATCQEGFYGSSSSPDCSECGAMAWMNFILVLVVGVAGVVLVNVFVNRDVVVRKERFTTVAILSGILWTRCQLLSVFKDIPISWRNPLTYLLEVASLVTGFDVHTQSMDCLFTLGIYGWYIARQAFIPVVLSIICLFVLRGKMRNDRKGVKTMPVHVSAINNSGMLYLIVFIPLLNLSLSPLICYDHPGDHSASMLSSSDVLCFQDGPHTGLLVMGLLSLFGMQIPFLCICFAAIRWYRAHVATDARLMRSFDFMFFRFRPGAYWYGALLIALNFSCCMVPVVFRDDVLTQTFGLTLLMLGQLTLVMKVQPWRTELPNTVDGLLAYCLVVILQLGAMYSDMSGPEHEGAVYALGVIACVIFCAPPIMTGIRIAWDYWKPKPYFHYFICHDNAKTGAQVRLLQLMLMRIAHRSCFIAENQLRMQSAVFDIVRCRTSHFVVYLAYDILKRPLCCGEILMGSTGEIPVTAVRHPTFDEPPEDLDELEKFFEKTTSSLLEFHITPDRVASSVKWLLQGGARCIDLPPGSHSYARTTNLALDIANHQRVVKHNSGSARDGVMVCYDPDDDEACAVAGILQELLQEKVLRITKGGIAAIDAAATDTDEKVKELLSKAKSMIILLSHDSLMGGLQTRIISQSASYPNLNRVSVTLPGFVKPSSTALAALEEMWSSFTDEQVDGLKAFLDVSTVNLVVASSSTEVLNTHLDLVFARLGSEQPRPSQSSPLRNSQGSADSEPGSSPTRNSARRNSDLGTSSSPTGTSCHPTFGNNGGGTHTEI